MSSTKSDRSNNQEEDIPPNGLINYGSNCYLNVVLQVLFMSQEFREQVLNFSEKPSHMSPEFKLIQALAELFCKLQRGQAAVSPDVVMRALEISNASGQQDAAEYLQMILCQVHKLQKYREPVPSEVFKGSMETVTECAKCKKKITSENEMFSITLSVNSTCDVEDALKKFFEIHEMKGSDQLYCTECKSLQDMKMYNNIKTWPNYLALQLKRFSPNNAANHNNIIFPEKFQLFSSPYYELYAIIEHYGTPSSGHYVANIKDERGNLYCFNDTLVTKMHVDMQSKTWISRNAYLLIYRKGPTAQHQGNEPSHQAQAIRNDAHAGYLQTNHIPRTNSRDKISVQQRSKDTFESKNTARNQSSATPLQRFKMELKKKFEFLGEDCLIDAYIERNITEEPHFHINRNKAIECEDIFGSQKIRTVLMKGDAGIGKTVTVQKFIMDWVEGISNQDIDYVFPLDFQSLNTAAEKGNKFSFNEFLQMWFKNTEDCGFNDSDKILLIFDGLNEFKHHIDFNTKVNHISEKASIPDLLATIINGNLLPSAQIWITSRPEAAKQIPDQYIHRVTEIQGFDEEQQKKYIQKNIKDKQRSSDVLKLIQESKCTKSMCSSPDYLRLFAESQVNRNRRDLFPPTLTTMYKLLVLEKDMEATIKLGKIAYSLLVNQRALFGVQELRNCDFRDGSFLKVRSVTKSDESPCFFKNHRSQEFLAALYFYHHISKGPTYFFSLNLEHGIQSLTDHMVLQRMMHSVLQKHLDIFFCFLLGLIKQHNPKVSSDIEEQIKAMIMHSSADRCCFLFDALKELDGRYPIREIKAELKSGLDLSPAQFSALIFVLLSSNEKMPSRDEYPLILQSAFKSSAKPAPECRVHHIGKAELSSDRLHLTELDLSGFKLERSALKLLSFLLRHPLCILEKLRLRSCGITDQDCAHLSSALKTNPSHLIELDLSGNEIGNTGVKNLADVLKNSYLKKLVLESLHISDSCCAYLNSALKENPWHLTELNLSGNTLGGSVISKLSDVLDKCNLKKLVLRNCHITYLGCADLSSALKKNPSHLKELDLSSNYFGDKGVKALKELLEDPRCKLEKLGLRSCKITDGGCADLSSSLKKNPSHLKELDLSGNDFGNEGVKALKVLLEDPRCKLEKLGLRSCRTTGGGCADLSSALKKNPSHLKELDLSSNDLGFTGLYNLKDVLEKCRLKKLILRSCKMTDWGCTDLSSALNKNPSHLKELDLSGNDFGDKGVKALKVLLEDPRCKLEKLGLRSCQITDGGCADLSSALKKNPSHLKELDLSENSFGDKGLKALKDVLEKCRLKKLLEVSSSAAGGSWV